MNPKKAIIVSFFIMILLGGSIFLPKLLTSDYNEIVINDSNTTIQKQGHIGSKEDLDKVSNINNLDDKLNREDNINESQENQEKAEIEHKDMVDQATTKKHDISTVQPNVEDNSSSDKENLSNNKTETTQSMNEDKVSKVNNEKNSNQTQAAEEKNNNSVEDTDYAIDDKELVENAEDIPQVKDDAIQKKIEENMDHINEEDLNQGTDIYNKLDTDYLFSLLEDGVTDEEKVTADEYLKSVLSGEEYEAAVRLFNNYVGLME